MAAPAQQWTNHPSHLYLRPSHKGPSSLWHNFLAASTEMASRLVLATRYSARLPLTYSGILGGQFLWICRTTAGPIPGPALWPGDRPKAAPRSSVPIPPSMTYAFAAISTPSHPHEGAHVVRKPRGDQPGDTSTRVRLPLSNSPVGLRRRLPTISCTHLCTRTARGRDAGAGLAGIAEVTLSCGGYNYSSPIPTYDRASAVC